MTSHANDILVGVDFSDGSRTVLAYGTQLARAFGCRLHVVHAAAPEPTFVGYDRPGGLSDRDQRAGELSDEHRLLQEMTDGIDDVDVVPLLVMGATVDVLVDEAAKHDVAMIVLGRHGHGRIHDALMGSTTESVIRKAGRPVLVVPVGDE
jgi:nucleotide-binding universal stress UspA family protein